MNGANVLVVGMETSSLLALMAVAWVGVSACLYLRGVGGGVYRRVLQYLVIAYGFHISTVLCFTGLAIEDVVSSKLVYDKLMEQGTVPSKQ
jgi:hypothetical protein